MLLLGMVLINFGIAYSIQASLGTSPVSSLPYVFSQFTSLTVGNWTVIVHTTALLLQILILRKDFNPINLGQLLLAVIFGFITDSMRMKLILIELEYSKKIKKNVSQHQEGL